MKNQPCILTLLLLITATVAGCSSSSAVQTQSVLQEEGITSLLQDDAAMLEVVNATPVNPQSAQQLSDGASFSRIQTLRIKHHMIECEGYEVSHCLLTQDGGSDEWTYFYDTIEGFDYRWGYDYEIIVEVASQREATPFGDNPHYSLIEVVEELKAGVDIDFTYVTRSSSQRIKEISPNHFSLLGNKEFTCTDDDACESLRSAIAQDQAAVLQLQHSNNPHSTLMLSAVSCVDSETAFDDSCI